MLEYCRALKASRCLDASECLRPRKARLSKDGEIRIGTMCPITYVGSVLARESKNPDDYEESSYALDLSFQAFGISDVHIFAHVADYTVKELRSLSENDLIPARRKLLKLFDLKERV